MDGLITLNPTLDGHAGCGRSTMQSTKLIFSIKKGFPTCRYQTYR